MPPSWLGWRFHTRNSGSMSHGYAPKPPRVLTNGERGSAALLPPDPFHNLREQRERKKQSGFEFDPFSINKDLIG